MVSDKLTGCRPLCAHPTAVFRRNSANCPTTRKAGALPCLAPKILRLLPVLLCATAPLRAQVVIPEFLASNSNSITDEDGDNEDWIGITSNSGSAVNLPAGIRWVKTGSDPIGSIRKMGGSDRRCDRQPGSLRLLRRRGRLIHRERLDLRLEALVADPMAQAQVRV